MSKLSDDLRACIYCNCTVDHVSEAVALEAENVKLREELVATREDLKTAGERAELEIAERQRMREERDAAIAAIGPAAKGAYQRGLEDGRKVSTSAARMCEQLEAIRRVVEKRSLDFPGVQVLDAIEAIVNGENK